MEYYNVYQEGGGMEDPTLGPQGTMGTPPEGADPAAAIEQQLGEYAQTRDPQLAVQICDALIQQMGAGAAGAPPAEGAMPPPPEGAPMGKHGMSIPAYQQGGQMRFRKIK